MVITVDFHQPDLTELSLAHDAVARFHQVRRAAPLRADLHHPFVLACGGQHRLAFDHVHGNRLLAIDMRAGLDGGDHGERVPVIRRADQDDIEILLREHRAIVAEGTRLLMRRLPHGHQFRGLRKHSLVHVAERDHLHGRNLYQAQQVRFPVPSAADHTDPQRLRTAGLPGQT